MSDQIYVAEFPVEILSAETSEDGSKGIVKAIVSTTNHPYQMGYKMKHEMLPGSHKKAVGRTPVSATFFQHNWQMFAGASPPVGATSWSVENENLVATAEFFLDTDAGRAVFNANKAKALKEWSIGYKILVHQVATADDGWETWQIADYELLENSSVIKGANDQTRTLEVASKTELAETVVKLQEDLVKRVEAAEAVLARGHGNDGRPLHNDPSTWSRHFADLTERLTKLEGSAADAWVDAGEQLAENTHEWRVTAGSAFKYLLAAKLIPEDDVAQVEVFIAEVDAKEAQLLESGKIVEWQDEDYVEAESWEGMSPERTKLYLDYAKEKGIDLPEDVSEVAAKNMLKVTEEIADEEAASAGSEEESGEPAGVDGGSEGGDVTATDAPEVPDSSPEELEFLVRVAQAVARYEVDKDDLTNAIKAEADAHPEAGDIDVDAIAKELAEETSELKKFSDMTDEEELQALARVLPAWNRAEARAEMEAMFRDE